MKSRKYILSLILSLCFLAASAQDNHFTLYYLAPLSLNPAETASMIGELRAGALYRNQWRSVDKPFSTISAYADKKFFFKDFDLGVGFSLLNDKSGPGGLNVTKIYPSVSAQKRFGKHNLIVGLQPGLVFKKIGDVTYPSQYDHAIGGYNSSLPSGESGDPSGRAYFDLNVGVVYILRSEKYEFQFGQAFHHVNLPNESLISSDKYRLPVRFTSNASYQHWLSKKLYIKPAVLFMYHDKATEFDINAHAGYRVIWEEKMQITARLGAAYRNDIQNANSESFFSNSDAVSVLAGASWNKIDVDFAYDITVSKLSEVSKSRGAFEIVITYKNAFQRKSDKIIVPCLRY